MQLSETTDLGIDRKSTAERVAAALRARLMQGEIAPGSSLRDTDVSESAGVARTTAREALQVLAQEGLVTHVFNKGAVVTRITPDDAREIYRVRAILESAGIRNRASAPSALVDAVASAARQSDQAASAGDLLEFVDADIGFHQQLVRLLESDKLSAFHTAILNQNRLAMSTADRAYGDLIEQARDHTQISELLVEREMDEAVLALERHLSQGVERIASALADASAPDL